MEKIEINEMFRQINELNNIYNYMRSFIEYYKIHNADRRFQPEIYLEYINQMFQLLKAQLESEKNTLKDLHNYTENDLMIFFSLELHIYHMKQLKGE